MPAGRKGRNRARAPQWRIKRRRSGVAPPRRYCGWRRAEAWADPSASALAPSPSAETATSASAPASAAILSCALRAIDRAVRGGARAAAPRAAPIARPTVGPGSTPAPSSPCPKPRHQPKAGPRSTQRCRARASRFHRARLARLLFSFLRGAARSAFGAAGGAFSARSGRRGSGLFGNRRVAGDGAGAANVAADRSSGLVQRAGDAAGNRATPPINCAEAGAMHSIAANADEPTRILMFISVLLR